MGIAWFAIANHCALTGLVGTKAKGAIASCHQCSGHQSPGKNKNKAAECCKTLRATLSVAKQGAPGYDTSRFNLQSYFVGPVVFPDESRVTARVVELDTGPPLANSFAESVLQRSILAHAPPVSLS
jgi:hypothetical protein